MTGQQDREAVRAGDVCAYGLRMGRIGKISRTWWRQDSDGTYFRNCPLVEMDRSRLVNKLPWRWKALTAEWDEIFGNGVTRTDSLPQGDRWIAYDDSPEATREWASRFVASRGRFT